MLEIFYFRQLCKMLQFSSFPKNNFKHIEFQAKGVLGDLNLSISRVYRFEGIYPERTTIFYVRSTST